jgi:hypothetical protein
MRGLSGPRTVQGRTVRRLKTVLNRSELYLHVDDMRNGVGDVIGGLASQVTSMTKKI